jgi:hypothetical protein
LPKLIYIISVDNLLHTERANNDYLQRASIVSSSSEQKENPLAMILMLKKLFVLNDSRQQKVFAENYS